MAFAPSGSSSSASTSTTQVTMATASLPVNTSLLLLSNMSSMMTVKLDYGNYIVWKHQIEVILDTYSMIDVLDDSIIVPDRFLKDSFGNYTVEINPASIAWKNREQAMFTFLNSTLSPAILAITVGQKSVRGVWKVLEKRFASVSRTRSDVLSVEELNVLLNVEERVIKKRSNTVDSTSMAMAARFHSQGFQQGRGGRNNNQRGKGRGNTHNSGSSHYGGGGYSNSNQFQNFNSSNFNLGNSGFSPQFQNFN
nr:hypothetical protein CFP56_36019 [Quercus suber]